MPPHSERDVRDASALPPLPRPPRGGQSRKLAAFRRPESSQQGRSPALRPPERVVAEHRSSSVAVGTTNAHETVMPESSTVAAAAATTRHITNSQTNSIVNNTDNSTTITNNYYDAKSNGEVAAQSGGPRRIEDGKVDTENDEVGAAKDEDGAACKYVTDTIGNWLFTLIKWLFAIVFSKAGAGLLVVGLIPLFISNLTSQFTSQLASLSSLFQIPWNLPGPWSSSSPPSASPEAPGGRTSHSTSSEAIVVRSHYFGATAYALAVNVLVYNAEHLARSNIPLVSAFARELTGTTGQTSSDGQGGSSASLVAVNGAVNMSRMLVDFNKGWMRNMARQLRREAREDGMLREAIATGAEADSMRPEPYWQRLLSSILPERWAPLPRPLATARRHLVLYHETLVGAGRHRNETLEWMAEGPDKRELGWAQHQMTVVGERSEAKRRELGVVAADEEQSEDGLAAVYAETDAILEDIAISGRVVGQLLGDTQLRARDQLRAVGKERAWLEEECGVVEDMLARVDRRDVTSVVAIGRMIVRGLDVWQGMKTEFYGNGDMVTKRKGGGS